MGERIEDKMGKKCKESWLSCQEVGNIFFMWSRTTGTFYLGKRHDQICILRSRLSHRQQHKRGAGEEWDWRLNMCQKCFTFKEGWMYQSFNQSNYWKQMESNRDYIQGAVEEINLIIIAKGSKIKGYTVSPWTTWGLGVSTAGRVK